MAGYEVLGKTVPWDWDCVSSSVGGGGGGGGRSRSRGRSERRFPPFGGAEGWM